MSCIKRMNWWWRWWWIFIMNWTWNDDDMCVFNLSMWWINFSQEPQDEESTPTNPHKSQVPTRKRKTTQRNTLEQDWQIPETAMFQASCPHQKGDYNCGMFSSTGWFVKRSCWRRANSGSFLNSLSWIHRDSIQACYRGSSISFVLSSSYFIDLPHVSRSTCSMHWHRPQFI